MTYQPDEKLPARDALVLDTLKCVNTALGEQFGYECPVSLEAWDTEIAVYLVADPAGRVKVGISNDPRRRLQGLQTGNHAKLRLVAFIWVYEIMGRQVERRIHQHFRKHRVAGEWFEVPAEMVMPVMEREARRAAKALRIFAFKAAETHAAISGHA